MPSPKVSRAGAVVAFFRQAPLDVAELVLDMCRDAVREKKALAERVKEGQQKAAKQREKEAAAKQAGKQAASGSKKKPANGAQRTRTRQRAAASDDLPPVDGPEGADPTQPHA